MRTRARRLPLALGALVLLLTAWAAVADQPVVDAAHGTLTSIGAVRDGNSALQPVRDAVVVPLVAAARTTSSWTGLPGALAGLVALLALAGWGRVDLGVPKTRAAPRRYAFAARRAPPTASAD
jgi:hypothetical protein